jgi:replicative DNA helicase
MKKDKDNKKRDNKDQPPRSVELQEDTRELTYALLGMAMRSDGAAPEIVPTLTEINLDHRAGLVLQVLADLVQRNQRIDERIVRVELRGRGLLADFGSPVPAAANDFLLLCSGMALKDRALVPEYLRQIERESRLAKLRSVGLKLIQDADADDADPDKLARLVLDLLQASNAAHDDGSLTTMGEIIERHFDTLEGMQNGTLECPALTTTFDALDRRMGGGLFRGEATVWAGDRGGGKTTSAMQILFHHALISGKHVLFISAEMTDRQLFERTISTIFHVPLERVRTGTIAGDTGWVPDDDETSDVSWEQIRDVVRNKRNFRHFDRLHRYLHVCWLSGVNVTTVVNTIYKTKSRLAARGEELELVVVDYVQRIRPDKAYQNREIEVSSIAQQIIDAAKATNVALLLLSQVNKEGQARESGAIEQHTDSMVRLIRNKSANLTELSIEKGRMHGDQGEKIVLEFDGARGLFREKVIGDRTSTCSYKDQVESTGTNSILNSIRDQGIVLGTEEDYTL